jgi:hypothetical protein
LIIFNWILFFISSMLIWFFNLFANLVLIFLIFIYFFSNHFLD